MDMKELIQSYKQTLAETKKMYDQAPEEDKKIISGMISDLKYAIEWMETARRPGNRRGVERLSAYQREKPIDPLHLQKYYRSVENNENVITEFDKIRIEDALSVLTEREKDIYLMSRGQMLSYEQIANLLCVTKSTIQTTIERAEKKIMNQISCSLFSCVG